MLIYLITDKYNHTFIILYDPIYNHHQIKIWSIYKYVFMSYLLYYLIHLRHIYNHYFFFYLLIYQKIKIMKTFEYIEFIPMLNVAQA